MPSYESLSEYDTGRIAAALAAQSQAGDIFLLQGTLGMGKSVFARHFIQEFMGADTDVPSPTFTIVQTYESDKGTIWHFDLYRLTDPEEIYEIGWEEALSGGILLVEWPERLGPHTPEKARHIRIEEISSGTRKITIDE